MSNLVWKIGNVRVTRIQENLTPIAAQGLFPTASPEALAPHASWLRPHFIDGEGNLLLSIHALVVESLGKRILVDTCIGEHQFPGYEDLSKGPNRFLQDLAEAGFPRESIDVVLCTHLHFDHVGWNTMQSDGRWVPTFPNARYLLGWEHWSQVDSDFVPNLNDSVRPVIEAGLSDLVEMDHRITEEVWLEGTPGHTPGHVSVRIASDDAQALITGDMTHHPVQWAELDWEMSADTDSKQAAETRRRLVREHADQPVLVIGTHYAPPCSGHLVAHEGGCRFDASER
jgi:glyoxylase-like metal-dependent hydrolase (beta-lactamase superfamily II)